MRHFNHFSNTYDYSALLNLQKQEESICPSNTFRTNIAPHLEITGELSLGRNMNPSSSPLFMPDERNSTAKYLKN